MKDSAFENFSEDALEALDFARCQRPDGSFYGTSGVCRKGTETGAKEKAAKAAKSSPKRDDSKDVKRGSTLVGTSPRNMLVDNIKTMEGKLKDSRSEGETKLLKDSIAKSKNVSMDPRQSHVENVNTSGFTVRALNADEPDFKFKIKNK